MSFSKKLKTKFHTPSRTFGFHKPNKRWGILTVYFFTFIFLFTLGINIVLAATISGDAPKPGVAVTSLSADWQKAINDYNNSYIINKIPGTNLASSYTKVPTESSEYKSFLKSIGGYDDSEAQTAATQYKESLSYSGVSGSLHSQADSGKTPSIAGALGQALMNAVLEAVIGVLAVLAYFCKYLLMFAAWTFDATLNPALYNFANNSMVTGGWTVVRDVCNLFFLLVLLFIAICTILKIEKYHAKKTLLMLIIIALLINFSKPIAVFIFDGSQLLMNMFLNQMTTTGSSDGPSTIMAKGIAGFMYDGLKKDLETSQTTPELAVYYLFVVVFLFMFAIALFVTAIFLVIRIIAVMILIIVSPFAFFASAVPDLNKMASSWWNALFKYCYYGPAAAFFLYLAVKFSIWTSGSVLPKTSVSGGSEIVQHLINYLTVLVFLYASILMSQQFGIQFASGVTKWADRSLKGGWFRKGGWPREIGAWGARTTGAADVYKGVKKGISQRPGFSWLDKESREKKSKARQEKWEGKVAPFNIAAARKKAKDRENDSEKDILRDAAAGKQDAIIVASKKGFSKDNNGNDLWTNPNVIRALENEELRKEAYGNLRDKGKTNSVIDGEIARQNIAADKQKIEELYNEELGKLSSNNLGKQDLGSLAVDTQTNPVGKQWIENRLKEFDDIDSRLISNMLSGGHSKNVAYIRDLRAQGKLDTPLRNNQQSNQSAGNSQTGGYQSGGYGP